MNPRSMALCAAIAIFAVASTARAEPVPDSFRERIVGASVVCYGAFSRLAVEEWPGRNDDEVYELQSDARQKRDFVMDLLNKYTASDEDFDLDGELAHADAISRSQTMSKEELLDLGIYCEDQLFALVDEAEQNGYTP